MSVIYIFFFWGGGGHTVGWVLGTVAGCALDGDVEYVSVLALACCTGIISFPSAQKLIGISCKSGWYSLVEIEERSLPSM
jgi:hypothetical protein